MFSRNEITFTHCLAMQFVWLMLAVGYNLVSIYNIENGYSPLKIGNPEQTLVMIIPFVLLLISGVVKRYTLYFYFGAFQTIMLFLGGVVSHFYLVSISGLSQYSSVWSCIFAIGINLYGVAVFYCGLRKSYFLKAKRL
ncbi:MAG: hypothetical protein ACI9UJ_001710 [bacterium]|jgi:hypothetical protein